MAIVYTISVNGLRVVSEDGLTDVVKEVDVQMTGTDSGSSFALPFTVPLGPADPDNFTAFGTLTEAELVSWVEAQTDVLTPYKAHIAMVVEKEVAKAALTAKPLPWAPPAPDPSTPPPSE
jgi:hypothetical protein